MASQCHSSPSMEGRVGSCLTRSSCLLSMTAFQRYPRNTSLSSRRHIVSWRVKPTDTGTQRKGLLVRNLKNAVSTIAESVVIVAEFIFWLVREYFIQLGVVIVCVAICFAAYLGLSSKNELLLEEGCYYVSVTKEPIMAGKVISATYANTFTRIECPSNIP